MEKTVCHVGRDSSNIHLSHPQHRLANGEVANAFFCVRVSIKTEPELEILRLRESQASKEQARLPRRPLIEVLHIGRQGPSALVSDERIHILNRLSNGSAIGGFKLPKVFRRRASNLANGDHHI